MQAFLSRIWKADFPFSEKFSFLEKQVFSDPRSLQSALTGPNPLQFSAGALRVSASEGSYWISTVMHSRIGKPKMFTAMRQLASRFFLYILNYFLISSFVCNFRSKIRCSRVALEAFRSDVRRSHRCRRDSASRADRYQNALSVPTIRRCWLCGCLRSRLRRCLR